MNVYLLDTATYERLYNCTAYAIDDVPLAKRQNIPLGVASLVLFAILAVPYIVCLLAICKRPKSSCYLFMFYIGVVDLGGLAVGGFFTGYFAIKGSVFCSSPNLIYILGVLAMGLFVL